ncbi:MAG TPA: anthranilate phosphoribosyltransferase [Candidatus Bathyarchaeia archaeon]|nr:anthranilate phosphoribosyltransferase [Candidatus Bathyarchaeia archaeon]
MIKEAISKVVERKDLEPGEARLVMEEIMSGRATSVQIAAFLTGLRMKGETVEEIVSFVHAMLQYASIISPKVDRVMVDTCGTGGDRIKTFNISTVSAFVSAGAGIVVAKHGNRAVSSKAGSADVLEALGLNVMLEPERVCECIEKVGIGFMFAPVFHPAMKYALGPRREIGIRTVFNILGPLANPAKVKAQVIGVYDVSLVEKIAEVLAGLGVRHAIVAHGLDGLDEISPIGETKIAELKDGVITTYNISPEAFGLERAKVREIEGGDADENAKIAIEILKGRKGARRNAVLMNAAAALVVGGLAENLKDGFGLASLSIDSGEAYRKLEDLVRFTGGPSRLERFDR